jgi:hypothetical protein
MVKNLDDPSKINRDIHVIKMIENPMICLDVLGRIYLAYIRQEKNINLKNTILEQYFIQNKTFYDTFVRLAIQSVPSFQSQNNYYSHWS